MLTAFLVSAIFITLAELGDKTQLLTLCLAARFRVWQVLVGVFAATLVLFLLATAVGRVVGGIIPEVALRVITGVLFVGFGIWTLRGDTAAAEDAGKDSRFGPVLATAVAFFIAELGDKTQIMTMTIAADPTAALRTLGPLARYVPTVANVSPAAGFWGVWLGSTVGMMIADGLAIVIGAVLGRKLPVRVITRVSGVIFVLFGVWALASAFIG